MKKVLILGSSGMLGHATLLYLQNQGYDVEGVSLSGQFGNNSHKFDLLEQANMCSFFELRSYDVIVNCVALLVKESAENKASAVYLNSYLPHFLASRFEKVDTKIIQVSTDGVFEGGKAPYQEDDISDVSNYYGRTKYIGELINSKDLTVRSAFWGPDIKLESESLFNWMMKQSGELQGYSDHIFNGVSSLEFAKFVNIAIREDISGLYHLIADNFISKHDFLKKGIDCFDVDCSVESVKVGEVSRVLVNTRNDVPYKAVSYDKMLEDVKSWINAHPNLYQHYLSR